MKLSDDQVARICRTILARWKEKGLVRPRAADDLLAWLSAISRVMFQKIKERLARERKIVL